MSVEIIGEAVCDGPSVVNLKCRARAPGVVSFSDAYFSYIKPPEGWKLHSGLLLCPACSVQYETRFTEKRRAP